MDGGDETVEGSIGEIDERGRFEKFRLQEQRMAPRWGHHVNARVQRGAGVLTPQPLASAIAAIAFKALFPSSTSSPVGATGRMSSVYLPPR